MKYRPQFRKTHTHTLYNEIYTNLSWIKRQWPFIFWWTEVFFSQFFFLPFLSLLFIIIIWKGTILIQPKKKNLPEIFHIRQLKPLKFTIILNSLLWECTVWWYIHTHTHTHTHTHIFIYIYIYIYKKRSIPKNGQKWRCNEITYYQLEILYFLYIGRSSQQKYITDFLFFL